MPHYFSLTERICGISMNAAVAGESVTIRTQELLGPTDPALLDRLEQLHQAVFSKIRQLPIPSVIDHLLILIKPDLSCTAYVNELQIQAMVRINRAIEAGKAVTRNDITEVTAVNLGVEAPPDNGVIVVRSAGWGRSLYYDLGPLHPEHGPRKFPLEQALAMQEMLLIGMTLPTSIAPVPS